VERVQRQAITDQLELVTHPLFHVVDVGSGAGIPVRIWVRDYSRGMAECREPQTVNAIRRVVVAAACALTLSACAGSSSSERPASSPTPESQQSTVQESPEEVPESLRFTARTVDGDSFDAKKLAGKKTVLWFWAPWCSECRREASSLSAVQKATADEVTFVGVASLGPVSDMKAFVTDYKVGGFEHLADVDGKVWRRFDVVRQPAHAFIDDDGSVELVRGEMDRKDLTDRVDALIAD